MEYLLNNQQSSGKYTSKPQKDITLQLLDWLDQKVKKMSKELLVYCW
jgi:hypothetical protein